MEDGRIPKDVLYGQLASGSQRMGRPALRFKDTCKCDMKACKIDTDTWEDAAGDRARWRQKVKQGIEHADSKRGLKAADKRARRKLSAASITNTPTGFISCPTCSRDCDCRLAFTATQDAAALQKPWTKPLLGATGIVFRDYALPTTPCNMSLRKAATSFLPNSFHSILPTPQRKQLQK